ncbi:enhancer of mRNA decapping, partial [Nowakowskiella sp. JEL0078]
SETKFSREPSSISTRENFVSPTSLISLDDTSLDEEDEDRNVSRGFIKMNASRSQNRRSFDSKRKSKKSSDIQTSSARRSIDEKSPGQQNRRYKNSSEWADGDVHQYNNDFDFQASLSMFDKKRIFKEIKEADTTDPETLLVNLNLPRKQIPKLGITEMVLEPVLSEYETGNDAEVEDSEVSDFPASGRGIFLFEDFSPVLGKKIVETYVQRTQFYTFSGILVPTLTPTDMFEIDIIAATETGPNDDQMIENGGRCAAMMVLQALGGGRRIRPGNHNAAPVVVVLA